MLLPLQIKFINLTILRKRQIVKVKCSNLVQDNTSSTIPARLLLHNFHNTPFPRFYYEIGRQEIATHFSFSSLAKLYVFHENPCGLGFKLGLPFYQIILTITTTTSQYLYYCCLVIQKNYKRYFFMLCK